MLTVTPRVAPNATACVFGGGEGGGGAKSEREEESKNFSRYVHAC